jgi:CrcB protein
MADKRLTRDYCAAAIGGAIGTGGRVWLNDAISATAGTGFPWGILTINLLGSFAIGAFSEATGSAGALRIADHWRVFVLVGLCGGFTTFSAFSLGTLELLQHGAVARAFAYTGLSLCCCVGAAACGVRLARRA